MGMLGGARSRRMIGMSSQRLSHGTGPGTITPDGCAVEYYALLEPSGEPERIHAAIPAGATILELGAGTGVAGKHRGGGAAGAR
jgi:hypothetical protein